MTFGKHIRLWREERRVGLRQFAKTIGVSPTFISKMEHGIGPLPGEATIRKIAVYFDKNPDELLALADKVAADVLAIIIKEPAYARFLRAHAHLTKDEWETLVKSPWLLLDSRVVYVPRSSNLIVVTLSSWNPLFFNAFIKALSFSGDAGAEDPGIQ